MKSYTKQIQRAMHTVGERAAVLTNVNMKTHLILGLLLIGLSTAQAVPTLRLSADGGGTWTTIADMQVGPPADANGAVGVVTYVGGVDVNWAITVTTGVTKPAMGTAARPDMDLNSVVISSTGAGSLIIQWADDFFGPTTGNALAGIGGTMNVAGGASVAYTTFGDAGNALFAMTTPLTAQAFGPAFGLTPFGGIANGPSFAPLGSPYSLLQQVTVTHGGIGITSFDAALTVPEGGSTVIMLGSVLSLLGVLAARRKLVA